MMRSSTRTGKGKTNGRSGSSFILILPGNERSSFPLFPEFHYRVRSFRNVADLFFENKIYGKDQKDKTHQMIPAKRFIPEKQERKSREDDQSDHLLDHL